jgi:heme/copper-type cytochrome/quinol oxidase subunit 2
MTLFFRKQDLDLAIGLALTIMLVMYTMYQSISQSLPQTAYLKFIDVWLMFCLMVPFFVFVVQVLLKIEMINDKKVEENNARPTKIKSRKENVKKFLLLLFPLTTVLFVSFYSAFALRFYSNL